ncbi:MAG: 30S ribosomal protein S3 [Proteobacteria bacterium]|nr:30S ribosomal protein S3 [Pseudomonadota bacterium]
MGQKVNPNGIRLGITKHWNSKWFANKRNYANYLNNDILVRKFLVNKLKGAAISSILIERPAKNARVAIYAARPGVIIGKKGTDVESLRKEVAKIMKVPVHISIEEVRKPDLEAKLVAENIAGQLERRVMFRRAMKRAVQTTMRHGAQGVKVCLAGRLAGAEIARTEKYREGRVPLHTFRADIDYGTAVAQTTYGIIGVKVWIFKGETHLQPREPQKKPAVDEATDTVEG